MGEGGGLINLGDLSKPVTVLIERVSDAVGGIAKPWQIKRIAKAETKADLRYNSFGFAGFLEFVPRL